MPGLTIYDRPIQNSADQNESGLEVCAPHVGAVVGQL